MPKFLLPSVAREFLRGQVNPPPNAQPVRPAATSDAPTPPRQSSRTIMIGLIIFLAIGTPSVLMAQAPPPDFKTFVYKVADGKPLSLDVFPASPLPTGPTPVLILVHGGAWKSGNKKNFYAECRYFSKRGIAAVTVDYRLLQPAAPGLAGTRAMCLEDVKSAIRWVKKHAAELNIDPARVILGGGSAGGHLATMAQLDTTTNDPQDDLSIPTTGVALVLFNPAYQTAGHPLSGLRPDEMKLEPYHYVSAQVPSMIMFYGDQDPLRLEGESFLASCQALGVKGEIWIAPGQKHAFFNKPEWTQATCLKADAFLTSLGLLQPGKPPLAAMPATLVRGP